MTAVFRVEMAKQLRRARTYVALGIAFAIPIVITIALKAHRPDRPDAPNDLFFLARSSGLVVPLAALEVMSRFLLVVVVALFAGDAISAEANWGSLRYILVRPIARSRLLSAKLAAVVLFAALATILIAVSGLAAGSLAFGWHGLSAPAAGIEQSAGRLLGNLGLATAYVAWSLSGVVSIGFMVSTMTDVPAGGIFAAVGVAVVSQILDALSALGSLRYGLPTHYWDAWTHLVTQGGPDAEMARGLLLQVPYVAVFLGLAWWWFGRKDVLS